MGPTHRERGFLPITAYEEALPQANVVIITGTALAKSTIDRLIEQLRGARTIAARARGRNS